MTNEAIYKSPWPKAIITFFIIIASVNSYILYMAIQNRSSAVTDDVYGNAVRYQEVIDKEKVVLASGLKPDIEVTCLQDCSINFRLISDYNTLPILSNSARLDFQRPDDIKLDFSVTAQKVSDTEFQTGASALKSGQWIVKAEFEIDDKPALYRQRIFIK